MDHPPHIAPRDQKVEYITELRESTNDTARIARNNLVVFLVVGLYLALLTSQSDDLLLATGGRLTIPLMEIGLPVDTFYALAPVLFLTLHLNLFLRLGRLADVATNLQARIDALRPAHRRTTETDLVFPLDFLQFLLHRIQIQEVEDPSFVPGITPSPAPRARRQRTIIPLLVIVCTPLFVLPVVLLGTMHWQFLRYQSEAITLTHQFVITLDVLLQIAFLLKVRRIRRTDRSTPREGANAARVPRYIADALAALAYGAAIVLTWWVGVVPGSWLEAHRPFAHAATWTTQRIFDDWWTLDDCTQRRYPEATALRRYLHLPRSTIASEEQPRDLIGAYIRIREDPTQAWQFIDELDIRSRSFRYARFEAADFWNVDLSHSDLTCARLNGATLKEARLINVTLDHTDLEGADLQGSDLEDAQGSHVDFEDADLSNSHLKRATFRYADFSDAKVDGAYGARVRFIASKLMRAQFNRVDLYGPEFISSEIERTPFNHSDLEKAEFTGSYLDQTTFHFSDLNDAHFDMSALHATEFFGTNLRGARFTATNAVRTHMYASDAVRLRFTLTDIRALRWSKPQDWDTVLKAMIGSQPPRGKEKKDWEDRRIDRIQDIAERYNSRGLHEPKTRDCIWRDIGTSPLGYFPSPGSECLARWETRQRELLCGRHGPSVRHMIAAQYSPIRSYREAYLAMGLLETQPRPCENVTAEEREYLCEALTDWFNDRGDKPSPLVGPRTIRVAADRGWKDINVADACRPPGSDPQGEG